MIESVGNHLWQSTVCALVAALVARLVGSGHPHVQHRIWLVASAKFLLPFSLLVAAGATLRAAMGPTAVFPMLPASVSALSEPFSGWTLRATAVAGSSDLAPLLGWPVAVLLGFWGAGAALVLIARLVQWRRVSGLARLAPVLSEGREVEALARVGRSWNSRHRVTVRESSSLFEPAVLGVYSPVLLWPAGLSSHLTDAEIEAIVAHEFSHVRRRDNLTGLVQMFAETLFWFHPLVWWMGARLIDARERACDQEVLGRGVHPATYAEGLLSVCRFCLRPQPGLAAGISSPSFSQRVEAIMTYGSRIPLGTGRRLIVAGAALLALTIPLASGMLTVRAQTPQPEPSAPAVDSVRPAAGLAGAPAPVAVDVSDRPVVPRPIRPSVVPAPVRSPAPPAVSSSPAGSVVRNPVTAVPVTPAPAAGTGPSIVPLSPPRVPVPVRPAAAPESAQPVAVPMQLDRGSPQAPPRDPLPAVSPAPSAEDEEFRRGALPLGRGTGVRPPVVLREVKPAYTSRAMREKIQGAVELEIVIDADGRVNRARVIKSLDPVFGLDNSALDAARQWTFKPAQLSGVPVATWATLVLNFRLE